MEFTITVNGHEYTVSLTRDDERTGVSIYMDGAWAGNGTVRHAGKGVYAIDACAAVLGDDVYDAIEDRIGDEFARGVGAEVDCA